QRICKERATKFGRKRTAALRVAPNLACGVVARQLQTHCGVCALLAPRHRPNWAQRTSSYLRSRPLSAKQKRHPDDYRVPLRKRACYFFGPRMASFAALATRNLTTFFAGMLICSPVAGLRPMRALRFTR